MVSTGLPPPTFEFMPVPPVDPPDDPLEPAPLKDGGGSVPPLDIGPETPRVGWLGTVLDGVAPMLPVVVVEVLG